MTITVTKCNVLKYLMPNDYWVALLPVAHIEEILSCSKPTPTGMIKLGM